MSQLTPTKRTKVLRGARRATYDRDLIHSILDEAYVCHVAFITDSGEAALIPTSHWRVGDEVMIHGSPKNRMTTAALNGQVCFNVTLIDGLVMARSLFHHSVNYRSVVIYGQAREVTDPDEKTAALCALVDKSWPGRAKDVRAATARELEITRVIALPITEASAKVRSGPPGDDEDDYALPIWAGEIPVTQTLGEPVADPRNLADQPLRAVPNLRQPRP